jgi:predicted nucleic acid-binding protein
MGLISVVSIAELKSLGMQFGWGAAKLTRLNELLRRIPLVDINHQEIIDRYAEIDTYSHGKLRSNPLPAGIGSRTMGKNDLWIAGTCSILNGTLLTIDHDFDHLQPQYLNVIYIDQSIGKL